MQYRYEIEHAPANLASAEGRTALVIRKRFEAVWVYKWGTLLLASPCSGTKRKTTVPLFFASTGGLSLLSFIPTLLRSLHLIDFYSPSLHLFRQVSAGQITPLTVPYCFSRLTLLISGYKVAMLLSVII